MSAVLEHATAPAVRHTREEAATAFEVALEQLAMRTYWESPHRRRPPYWRGFVAGFIGEDIPKESLTDIAVLDGYLLAERLVKRWNGRDRFI